ncbi:hypothetical protein Ccrd_016959, partial [Cynara cardunculus var. scolymus]
MFWEALLTIFFFTTENADNGWILFLGLMVPSREFQGFSHALVIICSRNLLIHEPLKFVDGGESHSTFVYIKDTIELVLLMI